MASGALISGGPAEAAPPGYVTLLFGRTQWSPSASDCREIPGGVNLEQVAAALQSRGLTGVGIPVVGFTGEDTRRCQAAGGWLHASWVDLARLRDVYGWTMVSGGLTHRNVANMTVAAQRQESCGSLPAFTGHGHQRAWGLFAYGNNSYTVPAQTNVVSRCFAYGRAYGPGRNVRSQLTAPWKMTTLSITGGRCHNTALPCYSMPVKNDRRYVPPANVAALMKPGPDQWNVVQGYRFVTGASGSTGPRWDCTGTDWRNHWTSQPELYCIDDYLSAVSQIPTGTVVTDPATVATAWGRIPPELSP